jgi:hypothetical protein
MNMSKMLIGCALVLLGFQAPAVAAEDDLRDSLLPENIVSVRVNLNPWGARLGFETEVDGDDSRVLPLVTLIREAEPGGGHKCANAGAMRFRMKDGSLVGVGLLPSHTAGVYELRLYDGDRYVEAYRVDRSQLLAALEGLGVPVDDPAFRE